MNAPTTEPAVASRARFSPQIKRRLKIGAIAYFSYLLLLGPLGAMLGHGYLDFLPNRLVQLIGLPAFPVFSTPLVRVPLVEYMDWWYPDPYRCGCCEGRY